MKYKSIILKISGEALSGNLSQGLCSDTLKKVAAQIAEVSKSGVKIGVAVGAGNFWRGRMDSEMNRTTADDMGMIATLINALALKDYIQRTGTKCDVLSSVPVDKFADYYTQRHAVDLMDKGYVVIFACGTGNPFVTTDTTGALRACEIKCDAFIQLKNIDAVYDSDPATNPNAKAFKKVSYKYIIENGLKAFDLTASVMCADNNIDSVMVALSKENSIVDACNGKISGTIISNDDVIEYY